MMKPLIVAAIFSICAIFSVHPVLADEKSEVLRITSEKIGTVIQLLKNKTLDKKERNKRIVEVVNPLFDFKVMARNSLGRKHWVNMTRAQKKEFLALFVKRLQESYLEKLDLYTDENVVIENATQVKKRIHVLTRLVSKTDKKDMVYKFWKSKRRGWRVYDIVILGVSVVQTYRSQFNGLLRKGTIEDVLKKLRETGGLITPSVKK
ncbi:MAG: ABC transporter substrate-binding protein [SAR324 cluster bacterium]|nr:ABC transporter substrate-binding protein [SAR324 cluster bacterium]